MAIFENVKNIPYHYQRLQLELINLNYGSIINSTSLLTYRPSQFSVKFAFTPISAITSDCCRSYANTEIVIKHMYFSLIVFPIITFLYYNVILVILMLN